MFRRPSFPAVVLAWLCGVAVTAPLVVAAESSLRRLDPALTSAQTPASSATTGSPTTGEPASAEELAKKLSNPVSSLISVPFQSNFDFNAGQDSDKFKYTLNIQPVIPLSIGADWCSVRGSSIRI
jgi:hypothetical protein